MSLELTARTEPGRAPRRARRERSRTRSARARPPTTATASFPFDSFAAVKQSGYFAAPIPEELGGLGVTSVHDVLVASSRLARGDAALTLGVNMHLVFVLNVVRRWQIARRSRRRAARRGVRGDARADRARRHRLRVRGQRAEAGPHAAGDDARRAPRRLDRLRPQGLLHDVARRRRPLHGRHLHRRRRARAVRLRDDPARDARASSSTTTGTRSACAPRAATPSPSRTCGSRRRRSAAASPSATRSSTWSGTSTPASSTRPPRSASPRAPTRASPTGSRVATELDPHTQMLAAENVVDLSACRAVFSRAAALIDEHHAAQPDLDRHAPTS